MAWSTAQVARMSGVNSRTLRHYDATGLVRPAYTGVNGYRYYEHDQLLRLQRVLLLRELGVGLRAIARMLDAEPGIGAAWIAALRRHHASLLTDRERLGRLAQTVARTIVELESATERSGTAKPAADWPAYLFEGFAQPSHEPAAREHWPEQTERSQRISRGFTREQTEHMQRELTQHVIRIGELMVAGTPADDPAVLDALDWHYRHVCRFWQPNAVAYANLGQMYVDDERFGATYERVAEGLAAYARDAMAAYAATRLR